MMPVKGTSDFRGLFKFVFAVPLAASFVLTGCGSGGETPGEEGVTPPDLDPMIQMENTTDDPSSNVDGAADDPAISG